jgi:hypothetical protein
MARGDLELNAFEVRWTRTTVDCYPRELAVRKAARLWMTRDDKSWDALFEAACLRGEFATLRRAEVARRREWFCFGGS